MGKGKRLAAEFELPETLMQHIQLFLNAKEAAQTIILSKSWYAAWLTRPNLDFDQKDFVMKSDKDTKTSAGRFLIFVVKIMKRYRKSNLKIDSLRLCFHGSYDVKDYLRVRKVIVIAMTMGATALDFKFHDQNRDFTREFTLPPQVFEFENLITLSLRGCIIGMLPDGKVGCSRLKSLTLDEVRVVRDIVWDIISSCPLIENLSLSKCRHLFKTSTSMLELSSFTEFGKQNVGSVVDGPIIMYEFRNIKHLMLSGVKVNPMYFNDFSSKFPCLKGLALHNCYGCLAIQISSHSLESISLCPPSVCSVKFDVPNILKFTFSGSVLPPLSFEATRSTWESHISINLGRCPNANWFLELKKFLGALSHSKVSILSLEIMSEKCLDCGEISLGLLGFLGLPKPKVENLKISGPCSVCPDLFYGLFQCCRPTYINHSWFPRSTNIGKKIYDFRAFVYNRTMLQVSLNSCFAYQRMSGWCDLEDVNVEFYDEAVSVWRPRLLDTYASQEADGQKHRLHLRWGR